MSEQRFQVARHLMATQDWNFFGFVDMGPDRLHHAFWRYCDPQHPRYQPGNDYRKIFQNYYRALDRHIGQLLEDVPDDAAVMVVSDHGAQPMLGGVCVNEWLRQQGLLVLAAEPDGPTPLSKAQVDWARTTAWAEGGYYGRIYLNVAGREPTGTVSPRDYDRTVEEIATALRALPDEHGQPMGTRAMRPDEVYPQVTGIPPDLIVYFGDLRYRALATLGLGQGLYSADNDTGPDHANHAEDGLVLLHGTGHAPGRRDGLSIYDIRPTLEEFFGVTGPDAASLPGKLIV